MVQLPENFAEFEALERYLELLQSGHQPDREQLLHEHPGLASALDCLEALERLRPVAAEAPSTDSLVGMAPSDFGTYELIEEIGRGGMGVVYKARQKSLDRVVAVKMILASHLASADHVRRFQAEARAAAQLSHPNIVHIHEVGQMAGQHYFVMEFVDGPSLSQRIAQGPMDIDAAVQLIVKVARAVDHLHRHQIVHRDLKPSNILLDCEGQPYVSDFGLAKVFTSDSNQTATGVIAGTPSYMSPEQAAGRTEKVGPASDVYSLGAILYELLTGQPPFCEENPLDTVMQVLSCDPVLPRRLNHRIPRRLQLICLKCLAKRSQDRYPSAKALAEDLERYYLGESLIARPPTLVERLWSWSRREPALSLRLAALAGFYAVELVNYYGFNRGDPAFRTFHLEISILLPLWAASSFLLQQALRSQRWALPARFLWGTLDVVLLTAILLIADGAASPLVIGYFLLIAGSGLWFRVRFVWFMTVLLLISYGILVLDFYLWRPALQSGFDRAADRHVLFVVAMLVMASIIAYLVDRVRTLSHFFGHHP